VCIRSPSYRPLLASTNPSSQRLVDGVAAQAEEVRRRAVALRCPPAPPLFARAPLTNACVWAGNLFACTHRASSTRTAAAPRYVAPLQLVCVYCCC
jgi:hypothetical protein